MSPDQTAPPGSSLIWVNIVPNIGYLLIGWGADYKRHEWCEKVKYKGLVNVIPCKTASYLLF